MIVGVNCKYKAESGHQMKEVEVVLCGSWQSASVAQNRRLNFIASAT